MGAPQPTWESRRSPRLKWRSGSATCLMVLVQRQELSPRCVIPYRRHRTARPEQRFCTDESGALASVNTLSERRTGLARCLGKPVRCTMPAVHTCVRPMASQASRPRPPRRCGKSALPGYCLKRANSECRSVRPRGRGRTRDWTATAPCAGQWSDPLDAARQR